MKFKQVGLTLVLLSANTLVFANNEEMAQINQEEQNSSLQTNFSDQISQVNQDRMDKPTSSQMTQEQQRAKSTTLGDKLPPYRNSTRFMADLSFIYWQAIQDGLEYGLVENGSQVQQNFVSTFSPTPASGYSLSGSFKEKDLNFQWDPGFKAGIGMIFGERDQWDLFLNWTWLKSNASSSFSGPTPFVQVLPFPFNTGEIAQTNDYIIPSWGSTVLGGPASSASSNWGLKYNTIDLELGRNFFLKNCVTLRPHIGLRGAFLHQNIKANYNSILNDKDLFVIGSIIPSGSTFDAFSLNNSFNGKNNYDAVGLRGGFDINWNFLNNFAFYGKLSGSVLWGRFKVEESFVSNQTTSIDGLLSLLVETTNNYNVTLNETYDRIRSTVQAAMGFTWHTGFNDDKQHLYISAGYEFNQWFQQNELREFIANPTPNTVVVPEEGATMVSVNALNRGLDAFYATDATRTEKREGDLGLQGLTFDVRFDF